MLRRLYSTEPRGLAKVFSLGIIWALPNPIVGNPGALALIDTDGNPGTATVPVGMFPPRRATSNPIP